MKKTVYIIIVIAILGIIAVYFASDNKQKTALVTTQNQNNVQPSSNAKTTNADPTQQLAQYKDGTFNGDIDTNQFGSVEVSITVSEGKINEVKLLQIPDADPRSKQLSEFATQQLVEATITSQSSDIDTISGATYTSNSYIKSLQSAIDKSRI